MDSSPEERFDRITRTAKELFNVPVATLNLLDDHRVLAKSTQGPARKEMDRRESFRRDLDDRAD